MARPVEFDIQLIHDTREFANDFVVRQKPSRESVASCARGFPAPPEELQLGYGSDSEQYLAGGRNDALAVHSFMSEFGCILSERSRVLDFGCAAGRLTRWITDVWPKAEAWGVDIDAPRITWARQNLSELASFAMTTKIPTLPFSDAFFDLCFAFSVFTHIDDLASMWLLELARTVRNGGTVLVTIMDENTIKQMFERHAEEPLPKRLRDYSEYYQENDFDMFSITRDSVPDVWYRNEYFKKMVQSAFDVIAVRPEFHGWQTGILLRKR